MWVCCFHYVCCESVLRQCACPLHGLLSTPKFHKEACPLTEHLCWLLQALKKLVKDCWDPNPEKRTNFEEVVKVLDKLIKTMPREHSSGGGGGCCSVQ